MSPNDIDVLFHYHCCTGPHERLHAPAVKESLEMFISHKLIEVGEDGQPYTTCGGRMLVDALCSVPFPMLKWCMP